MRPAWSVVFLTTLIGAGQGVFAAAFAGEVLGAHVTRGFLVASAVAAVALAGRRAGDRKSTRLNSSHIEPSRMPSSA